ncbi:MAG: 2-isopropylmalate synthase, partial [Aeromonadaceae bacterium]
TVGYTVPSEFGGIIQTLFNRVPNIDKAIISVHCHDDLGLSVANSIAAVQMGARQVEGTLNGIGERAGNCSLEEIAMILKTRADILGVHTNLKHQEIHRTSQLVSRLCNMPIQPNKAIVGANAFSHSSGIHQDGVLKAKNTYENITPESIGLNQNTLNMTSRSGRHVIKHRMELMGYAEGSYNLDELYTSFLKLADKKGQVFDYDLEALLFFSQIQEEPEQFKLDYLSVLSGGSVMATASVRMKVGGEMVCEAATGNGPVDAVYQCINRITGYDLRIDKYELKSKGEGKDALGQVDIVAEYEGRKFHGMGLATDIVESSAQALVHVMNNIHRACQVAEKKEQISQKSKLETI